MENTENKPNNENQKDNKNKVKMKIYEDQTQIQQFVEPEWMKILKILLQENPQLNEKFTMAKNHSIMVENG